MSGLLKVQKGGNFYIQEFVSPYWMKLAKSPEHVIQGLKLNNPAMIEGTQLLRNIVDESITLNNWHRDGAYEESVLRTPHGISHQHFALFSSHMFWGAADHKFKTLDISDVYGLILKNENKFNMIIAMEDINYTRSSRGRLGRDWLHILYGYRKPKTNIRIIKP